MRIVWLEKELGNSSSSFYTCSLKIFPSFHFPLLLLYSSFSTSSTCFILIAFHSILPTPYLSFPSLSSPLPSHPSVLFPPDLFLQQNLPAFIPSSLFLSSFSFFFTPFLFFSSSVFICLYIYPSLSSFWETLILPTAHSPSAQPLPTNFPFFPRQSITSFATSILPPTFAYPSLFSFWYFCTSSALASFHHNNFVLLQLPTHPSTCSICPSLPCPFPAYSLRIVVS